jgi:hypothetical protein
MEGCKDLLLVITIKETFPLICGETLSKMLFNDFVLFEQEGTSVVVCL